VRFRIAFPSYQVLLLATSCPFLKDLLNLPFWLTIHEVRGWLLKVSPMLQGFLVWEEEASMEGIVDASLGWQFKAICGGPYYLRNFKGSIALGVQFGCWMSRLEVSSLQPDLLAFLIWSVMGFAPS